jgi:hypothetical protein
MAVYRLMAGKEASKQTSVRIEYPEALSTSGIKALELAIKKS